MGCGCAVSATCLLGMRNFTYLSLRCFYFHQEIQMNWSFIILNFRTRSQQRHSLYSLNKKQCTTSTFLLRNIKMFLLHLLLISVNLLGFFFSFFPKTLEVVKRTVIDQGSIKTTAVSEKKCIS